MAPTNGVKHFAFVYIRRQQLDSLPASLCSETLCRVLDYHLRELRIEVSGKWALDIGLNAR